MLNATSSNDKLKVMGKSNDIDCAYSAHHLLSDSDGTSTSHAETPADERTKERKDIKNFSSVTTQPACGGSRTSAEISSDQDTSNIIWHDLGMKDCPTIGTITSAVDLVTKETFVVSPYCPHLEGNVDHGLERHSSPIDRDLDDATAKPTNAMLPLKRIMNSPRSALTTVSDSLNNTLSCSDGDDDSEVFADVIYAPEIYRDSSRRRPRSIRFSDEKEGETLATIHLIPWTEDDDANWLPRLEKCRMEL